MSLLRQRRAEQSDQSEPAVEPEVAGARGAAAWTAALAYVVRQATDAAFNKASTAGAASVSDASVLASERRPLTPEHIALVKTSFEHIIPIIDTAAALFHERLFELDSALRPLFKGDLYEHGRKLISMLGMTIKGLDRLNDLVPAIQQLGARHRGYGARDEQYATVAAALLATLREGLGERFTPEVRAAWAAAYTLLADTMRAAAAAGGDLIQHGEVLARDAAPPAAAPLASPTQADGARKTALRSTEPTDAEPQRNTILH